MTHAIMGHVPPTPQKDRAVRGRPADPEIERRVAVAAISVYSEVGWAGFTVDAVASRSSVGKAAIYRRWPTKQELLTHAIRHSGDKPPVLPESGELREDLRSLAEYYIERLGQPAGLAELRLQMDAKIYPDVLGTALDPVRLVWIEFARRVVSRAVEREELPSGTPSGLIFDAVRGAVINRFLLVPSGSQQKFLDTKSVLASRIVDLVLNGARHSGG